MREQPPRLVPIHRAAGKPVQRKLQRHLPADLCQPARQARAVLPFLQLAPQRRRETGGRQGGVHAVHRAVFRNQLERRLLPDARHAGNIVRSITHERLDVHEPVGRNAVAGGESRLVHISGLVVARQQDMDTRTDKLQRVPVSGQQVCRAVAALLSHACQRAENIIRFIPLVGQDTQSQHGCKVPRNRHLLCQLIRHCTAPCLIRIIHPVAERGRLEIVGNGGIVRLQRLYLL